VNRTNVPALFGGLTAVFAGLIALAAGRDAPDWVFVLLGTVVVALAFVAGAAWRRER
jgi:hypothetical protein